MESSTAPQGTATTGTAENGIAAAPAPLAASAPDLTRDGILNADDLTIKREFIPEWGGYVYVKSITGEDRDKFEASLLVTEKQIGDKGQLVEVQRMSTENIRAKLLVECLCDAQGNKMFSDADVAALGKKSAAGLTRCYNIASKLNAVTDADVDELAGNSARAVSSGS